MSKLSNFLQTSGYDRVHVFSGSATWSPIEDIDALIVVIGAGGSGAHANCFTTNLSCDRNTLAQGGNSGAVVMKRARLAAATSYTITVGAGGAAKTSSTTADATTAGSAGGNSSFAGSGLTTLTANGGVGGQVYGSTSTSTLAKQTAATATGGDFNYVGGQAGSVEGTSAGPIKPLCASGGAAVNILGLATGTTDSGNVASAGSSAESDHASGGGGIGGTSGNVTDTSTANGGVSAGGSSSSSSANISEGVGVSLVNDGGGGSEYASEQLLPFCIVGRGGAGADIGSFAASSAASDAGPGGGSGGVHTSNLETDYSVTVGIFAGGGGTVGRATTAGNAKYARAGSGRAGGGGGGLATYRDDGAGNLNASSGAGGNGLILVYYKQASV